MRATVTLVACKDRREARRIARTLVKEKLAACATLLPRVTSFFVWQGKLEEPAECLLLVKSRARLARELARRIRRLHSYSVPEILTLPVLSGNPEYLRWVRESTSPAR